MASKPFEWTLPNVSLALYRFFASFKLATVVLILLALLTIFGTYYQVDNGLYASKRKYFHSMFVLHQLFGVIPLPLPGGLLLMLLLFINMVLGAIVKVKKRWRGVGLLISHFGMLMLLAGGFVTFAVGTDGYMALYPGQSSNRVESYRYWQLEVFPLKDDNTADKSFVVPAETLHGIREDERRVIDGGELPFNVIVNGFALNSQPVPTTAPIAAQAKGKEIEGFKLAVQEPAKEAERNLPGIYFEVAPKSGEAPIETILWAGSAAFLPDQRPMPYIFEVDGQRYGALLSKKSWTVPFDIRLDEFIFEKHPGISMARHFESRVTKMEEGKADRPVEIKMNEPLRHAGFIFFQESFGPNGSEPGDRMFSQFAVANNPSDQWPLYSLIITFAGLGIHFVISLLNYRRPKTRKAAA